MNPISQSESEGFPLVISIAVPNVPSLRSAIFPENNFIGTVLFHVLLRWALGDLLKSIGIGGGLNKSNYLLMVTDEREAVGRIVSCLEECQFAEFARVYRFDNAEGVLRCAFPESGNVAASGPLMAEIEASKHALRKAMETLGNFGGQFSE